MCSRPGCVYSATVAVESSEEISPSATTFGYSSSSAADVLEERQHLRLRVVVAVPLVAVGIVGLETAPPCATRSGRGGLSRSCASWKQKLMASRRRPSTPRSSQKRMLSSDGAPHIRVVEVQVGLLAQEIVQVVLPAARFPGPGDTAEDRQPVVGRRAVFARVGPHVPVGLGIVAALPAFLEPRVLVGSVARHLVDDDLESESMRLRDEPVEIRERAEDRIDGAVVGDVVAEIRHRRLEEGRDPDRIDAEAARRSRAVR